MATITTETKTNGYKADGLQKMITIFEAAAARVLPGCAVSHFYYGDNLDMMDVSFNGDSYGHFNLTANRVSLNGYGFPNDEVAEKFKSLTHNDELYNGKLLELAGAAAYKPTDDVPLCEGDGWHRVSNAKVFVKDRIITKCFTQGANGEWIERQIKRWSSAYYRFERTGGVTVSALRSGLARGTIIIE